MLDIFRQLATDENLETNGTWVKYGGASFLLARAGNPKYTKVLGEKVDANREALDVKGEHADALSLKLLIEVAAETILLDWKDVKFKGAELPYSKENAIMVLGVKDFRVKIFTLADDISNYLVKEEADQAKN